MSSKNLIRVINFLLLAVIIAVPLFYFSRSVYPYVVPKTLFFQAAVEIVFFLWLALAISDKRYRPKATPLLKAIIVFLAVLTLTAVLGADSWRSFWSTEERAVGVVFFYHLAALALVISSLKKEIPSRLILYVSLAVASIVSFIGFLQLYFPHIIFRADSIVGRPGSTFGNPTFMAGYLLFHVFLCLYFIYRRPLGEGGWKINPWETIFLSASLALNVGAVFLGQTRGSILGLAAGIFVVLILFLAKPPQSRFKTLASRKFYSIILILLIVAGAGFWFTRLSDVWDKIPGISRFGNLSLADSALAPRLSAADAAWQGFKERPLVGWGLENFNVVFNKYYNPQLLGANYVETRFDKPHNFIMEYLDAGGLLLFLSYMAVFVLFVWESWKTRDRLLGIAAIGALSAYIANNAFVFETIGPLLMLFFFFGIIDGFYAEEKEDFAHEKTSEESGSANIKMISVVALAAALVFVYILDVLPLQASYYQYGGLNDYQNKNLRGSIVNFKEAVNIWSPYNWNIKRDYASIISEMYFYNPEFVPKEEVRSAISGMEEVARDHPNDAYNHSMLVDMYNQTSDIDPGEFLAAAEREAQIALQLSPLRQEIYFSLAKTKSLEGDNPAALSILQKMIDLNPKVPDAHFYYGLIVFLSGDPKRGYLETKEAVALGRKWKNANEPRVVANLWSDCITTRTCDAKGGMEEAIDLYKVSLGMDPNDLETKVKLGVAYFFAGKNDLAREYILDVGRQFDFKTSPSYDQLKPIFAALGLNL